MERYKISKKESYVNYGNFKVLVQNKHEKEYGIISARNILENSTNILRETLIHKQDVESNNNSLLVGKVQSGKTSNLEMITALAFDNNINIAVIFGGYDTVLVNQCVERFTNTFEIGYGNDDTPYLLSNQSNELSYLNDEFFIDAKEENRPVIFVTLKNPNALRKLNLLFKNIDKSLINALIIDDEGDQASLNTKKNSDEASSTYTEIVNLKRNLDNPIYFSVTATPQATIFQPEISEIMPSKLHLIPPANSYVGSEVFHLIDNNVFVIPEEKQELNELSLTKSLKLSIDYFIIASALMKRNGIKYSDMIVHSYREKSGHKELCSIIEDYIGNIAMCINQCDSDLDRIFIELKSIYNESHFPEEILVQNRWTTQFEGEISKVIKGISVIEHNGDNSLNRNLQKVIKHKIYVGGDLLQRGITFKHLVTTYFTRWANNGNMDTSLQRARWFGYRSKYFNLCKVFTTNSIKFEFSNLAQIENDLWSQFELVNKGEIDISDIIIDASNTKLSPTRKNVADFKKVTFNRMWYNQKNGVFDNQLVKDNNSKVEQFISNYNFDPISTGRTDGKTSSYISTISTDEFIRFIQSLNCIFDQAPFAKIIDEIKKFSEKICFQKMFGDDLNPVRKRTFRSDVIAALQQGADSVDSNTKKYYGDSHVIGNKDQVCVQVFKILPIMSDNNNRELEECTQYMFSIHLPFKNPVFRKK